ncbi:hypothetical protein FACS1894147_03730 [Spirochaetia bacterium]|nr:hypothetical protein FACS1894147_03730 [Spirochaetia bacterium]
MKRFITTSLFITAMFIFSCATTGSSGDGVSLDEAIEQSAEEVAAELPRGTRVAIVAFTSEHENISNYLTDELTGALVDGNFEVADRRNLAYVYKELGFQMSGDVSDETAVSIGKFLGASYVITGQLVKAGDRYRYRLAGINVETAVQESSTRLNVRNDRSFQSLLADARYARLTVSSADYGESTSAQPQTAGAFLDRGISFARNGDYDTAIEDFNEAIRLDSKLAAAYFTRGYAYSVKGDNDRAIADYTQAIRIDPDDASAYYNRGNAYANKKDYDRAIADYTQAIRIYPDFAKAYYNRGLSYGNKQDYDRAIADYTQVIRIDPNFAFAYNNRANAYANKGDFDRAIADNTQAISIDPNDANTYFNRGDVYYNKQDYDRAIADYEAGLRIDPNDAIAQEWLGNARKARGY